MIYEGSCDTEDWTRINYILKYINIKNQDILSYNCMFNIIVNITVFTVNKCSLGRQSFQKNFLYVCESVCFHYSLLLICVLTWIG